MKWFWAGQQAGGELWEPGQSESVMTGVGILGVTCLRQG